MGCQSFAIDLPTANISAALSAALTVTDEADRGDGCLPVDGRGTLIRPEGRTVREGGSRSTGRDGAGRLLGEPSPGQSVLGRNARVQDGILLFPRRAAPAKIPQKPPNNQSEG